MTIKLELSNGAALELLNFLESRSLLASDSLYLTEVKQRLISRAAGSELLDATQNALIAYLDEERHRQMRAISMEQMTIAGLGEK